MVLDRQQQDLQRHRHPRPQQCQDPEREGDQAAGVAAKIPPAPPCRRWRPPAAAPRGRRWTRILIPARSGRRRPPSSLTQSSSGFDLQRADLDDDRHVQQAAIERAQWRVVDVQSAPARRRCRAFHTGLKLGDLRRVSLDSWGTRSGAPGRLPRACGLCRGLASARCASRPSTAPSHPSPAASAFSRWIVSPSLRVYLLAQLPVQLGVAQQCGAFSRLSISRLPNSRRSQSIIHEGVGRARRQTRARTRGGSRSDRRLQVGRLDAAIDEAAAPMVDRVGDAAALRIDQGAAVEIIARSKRVEAQAAFSRLANSSTGPSHSTNTSSPSNSRRGSSPACATARPRPGRRSGSTRAASATGSMRSRSPRRNRRSRPSGCLPAMSAVT